MSKSSPTYTLWLLVFFVSLTYTRPRVLCNMAVVFRIDWGLSVRKETAMPQLALSVWKRVEPSIRRRLSAYFLLAFVSAEAEKEDPQSVLGQEEHIGRQGHR